MNLQIKTTLLRIYLADEHARGAELDSTFEVRELADGATVQHQGWDEAWPAPPIAVIDDLHDRGLLRVTALKDGRSFSLTPLGRRLGIRIR